MITLFSANNKIVYNIKDYIADTESDVSNLPTDISVGSMVKVISTGNTYILNGQKRWIRQEQDDFFKRF